MTGKEQDTAALHKFLAEIQKIDTDTPCGSCFSELLTEHIGIEHNIKNALHWAQGILVPIQEFKDALEHRDNELTKQYELLKALQTELKITKEHDIRELRKRQQELDVIQADVEKERTKIDKMLMNPDKQKKPIMCVDCQFLFDAEYSTSGNDHTPHANCPRCNCRHTL